MWNLTRELIRREHNFPGRFKTERCLSFFDVYTMKIKHRVMSIYQGHPKKVSFCTSGNLLCVLYDNSDCDFRIAYPNTAFILNWKLGIVHIQYHFPLNVNDIKFLKRDTKDEAGEIVTALNNGSVEDSLYCVGNRSFVTHFLPEGKIYLASCQYNFNEIIGACQSGQIFIIDLMAVPKETPEPSTTIQNTANDILSLSGIWHHPLKAEICVACNDSKVRVYDKFNLEKPLKTLYRDTEYEAWKILNCSYNKDGSEILVTYSDGRSYIFNNDSKIAEPTEIAESQFYKNLHFFGRDSEFLVGISFNHPSILCFLMKNTGEEVQQIYLGEDYTMNNLEVHPNLPVIAALTENDAIIILAPEDIPLEPYKKMDNLSVIKDIDVGDDLMECLQYEEYESEYII